MNILKKLFKRRAGLKIVLILLVLYAVASIGYYHLPWSVRQPIHERAPQIDRLLKTRGFNLLQGWDHLALFGHDATVPVQGDDRGDHVYGGYPSQGFQLFGRVTQLENRGYTVGYSESQRNPLWVAYRIFDVPKLHSGKRPTGFRIDYRTKSQVAHDDYTHSGYDRGHMAPNYGIATRYGKYAQKETFLMTNIIPQKPRVNRYLWNELEQRVARKYGRYFSEVWVITGPVFQKPVRKLDSGVPVPSHYYKILADEHAGQLRTLAFLVEADLPPYARIRKHLVSIDQLEELTGLDFFPGLSEAAQTDLESKPASRLWPTLIPALQYRLMGKTH